MLGFALCHGWAYDAAAMHVVQKALALRFPQSQFALIDQGFFGEEQFPALSADMQWIAVGHSYGFSCLLQQPYAWKAMVALNGFTRFCRLPGKPQGTARRIVDAMLSKLVEQPESVLRDFHERCGMPGRIDNLQTERLFEHLQALRNLDLGLPNCPVLALGSSDDAIVSSALFAACFEGKNCQSHLVEGDHTRLLRDPSTAVDAISAFLKELS